MKFRKEYNEIYYLTHKDDYKEDNKFKNYYKENQNQILDYANKYYQLNKEKMNAYQRDYYEKNKTKMSFYYAEVRKKQRERRKHEIKPRMMKQSLSIQFD